MSFIQRMFNAVLCLPTLLHFLASQGYAAQRTGQHVGTGYTLQIQPLLT